MNTQKNKIGFVFVLYKTPQSEISRLKKEVKEFVITPYTLNPIPYTLYFIDNSDNGQGYATGVNAGIKKAIADDCNLFVIANPDISLVKLVKLDQLVKSNPFDIWSYSMHQQGKTYYGGQIDRWRMSGGLIEKKPDKRFVNTDFVSGSLMVIKKKSNR